MKEEEKAELEVYDTQPHDNEQKMNEKLDNTVKQAESNKNGNKGFFNKLFDKLKTKIIDNQKEKEDEKKFNKEIYTQARKEAMREVVPALKEKIKQQEIEKLSKPKRNVLQKIGDEFKSVGGGINTEDKLKSMLGSSSGGSGKSTGNISEKIYGNAKSSMLGGNTKSNDEILNMLKVKSKATTPDKVNVNTNMGTEKIDMEAKIKKMLGK